jgi:hypothetical protein
MHVSDPDAVVRLTVRPHLERGGFHLDRFDAYLDGELIVTSRQPLLDGARRLLERGFDPEALLTMQMHDRPYDSFQPKPMRELAEWTIKELDRRGLRRQRWEPFQYARPAHPIHARSADQSLAVGWIAWMTECPFLTAPGAAETACRLRVWGALARCGRAKAAPIRKIVSNDEVV